jgi:anti-sigma B factor antagonist
LEARLSVTEQFTWRIRRAGVTIVIELAGELDVLTAPQFRQALIDLGIGQANGHIAVDMSELEFMDSTGIGVLVDAHQRIADRGGSLVLWDPSPSIAKLMKICGLGALFAIERDTEPEDITA